MTHTSAADSSGESATRQGVIPPNLPSSAYDDVLPTTRMELRASAFQPPLPSFASVDAADSMHDAPLETRKLPPPIPSARATSWNTKPGGWWMSLSAMVQGKKTAAIIVPTRWTRARIGVVASCTGVVAIVAALVVAFVVLGIDGHAPTRDALAVTVAALRVVVALAVALFGWGLVRLGERLTARPETLTRSTTLRTP